MEQDRYQKNHKLFILGMLSLVISLGLFAFAVYILPNLLFGWVYDVPSFVTYLKGWLQSTHNFTDPSAGRFIFLCVFLAALIFAFIAYVSSNWIDNQIYSDELNQLHEMQSISKTAEAQNSGGEGTHLFFKILGYVMLIIIVALLVDWYLKTQTQKPFMNTQDLMKAIGS